MIEFSTKRITDEEFLSLQTKLFLCTKNKKIDHFKISYLVHSSLSLSLLEVNVFDSKGYNVEVKIYDFDGYEKALELLNIALELFENFNIKKSKEKLKKVATNGFQYRT